MITVIAIATAAGAVRQFRMRRALPAVSRQQTVGSVSSTSCSTGPGDNVSRSRSGNSTEIYFGNSSCDVDKCDSRDILNSQIHVLCHPFSLLTQPIEAQPPLSECSAGALPWKLISYAASTDSKPCAWHIASASLVHTSGKSNPSATLCSNPVTRADECKQDHVSDTIFLRRRSSTWDTAA